MNECPKCHVVLAKGGGCTNHEDCPMRSSSPEIEGVKPEPPAPAAMSADNFLKETALYIAEATQHKHRALSSSGVEDYFRHYGDLRAQEAVRAFAKELHDKYDLFKCGDDMEFSRINPRHEAELFINTTKG